MQRLLADHGARVSTAASAAEARALFEELGPDLVLLDIRLQGHEDGIALALDLNARRPVPLIFVSSMQDRATFERARAAQRAWAALPYEERARVLRRAGAVLGGGAHAQGFRLAMSITKR